VQAQTSTLCPVWADLGSIPRVPSPEGWVYENSSSPESTLGEVEEAAEGLSRPFLNNIKKPHRHFSQNSAPFLDMPHF
jgi:hypothetical protein